MTDARLRSEWLGQMKFDDLSDKAWRVFTLGLMWSVEQGTDGFIPKRYLKTLHPDGEDASAFEEIRNAGLWLIGELGVQFLDWDGSLGQSTAEQIEAYKSNARKRQRAYRERERQKLTRSTSTPRPLESSITTDSAMRDVTRDMTHDVGEGEGEGEGKGLRQEANPINTNPQTGQVLDWPTVSIPTDAVKEQVA